MAFTYKEPDEYKDALKKQSQDEANLRNYQTYTPTEYAESDEVKGLWNTIFNWEHPTWDRNNNQWWNKLTDTMNAIENREKFSYDVNGDALYQQYKDQYINQGKMAMMDTMGQAAAMTGGYGNSYAQSVGQQAYQGYLQQLTDKIPELYQMALDKYNSEGAEMYNKLSAYGDLYSTEYGEHRDAVSDSKDALAHKTDLYGIKSDEDYKHWYNGEQLKMAASEQEYQKLADLLGISTEAAQRIFDNSYKSQFDSYTTKYTEEQDEIANDLALKKLEEEQRQFDENLKYDATGSATLSDGTKVTKAITNSGEPFEKYVPTGKVDEDGNVIYLRGGKEYSFAKGKNPYTGTTNPDAKNGTFSNGYQPDNIGGKKLQKSGYTCEVNGVTQNVWQIKNSGRSGDVSYYAWDGTKNMYEEIPKEAFEKSK